MTQSLSRFSPVKMHKGIEKQLSVQCERQIFRPPYFTFRIIISLSDIHFLPFTLTSIIISIITLNHTFHSPCYNHTLTDIHSPIPNSPQNSYITHPSLTTNLSSYNHRDPCALRAGEETKTLQTEVYRWS